MAGVVAHPRVSCDRSGQHPVVGIRYKKVGDNFDLCAAEFNKVAPTERAKYVAISVPQASTETIDDVQGNPALKLAEDSFLDAYASLSAPDRAAFLLWVKGVDLPPPPPPPPATEGPAAEASSGIPAASAPTAPTPAAAAPHNAAPHNAATNVHEGVTCDVSGMSPIVGNRWKKIDANYDLCEAEYLKLSTEEQASFVCLPGGAPSIKIKSPLADTKWPMGSIQQIEWESTGTISAVKIQYAEKSWNSWLYDWSELAISGRTDGKIPNTGRCRWKVPTEGIKPGTKMYFRISSQQQEDPSERSVHTDSELFELVESVPPPPEKAEAPAAAAPTPLPEPSTA